MIFYYLDASAWVKRYYKEKGTDFVQLLFAQDQYIACSSLGMIEVAATLSRKLKAREITRLQYKQKDMELEADWELFIQIKMNDETVSGAKELINKFALRGSDAVHLSSALLLQSRFAEKDDRLTVVVSDKELKEAARASRLDVVDPEEKE